MGFSAIIIVIFLTNNAGALRSELYFKAKYNGSKTQPYVCVLPVNLWISGLTLNFFLPVEFAAGEM